MQLPRRRSPVTFSSLYIVFYFLVCIQHARLHVLAPPWPAQTTVLSSGIVLSLSPAKPEERELLPSALLSQVYLPKRLRLEGSVSAGTAM